MNRTRVATPTIRSVELHRLASKAKVVAGLGDAGTPWAGMAPCAGGGKVLVAGGKVLVAGGKVLVATSGSANTVSSCVAPQLGQAALPSTISVPHWLQFIALPSCADTAFRAIVSRRN
jgi:hypothetical protein